MAKFAMGLLVLVLVLTATMVNGVRDEPMKDDVYNAQLFLLNKWLRGRGFPGFGGQGGLFPGNGGLGGLFPGFGRPGIGGPGGSGGLFPGIRGLFPGKPPAVESVEAQSNASLDNEGSP